MLGGTARLVWAETNGAPGNGAFAVFNREARLTMNVTDLLQSTSAVIDLFDGDVLERGTYLPSGVRETRTLDEAQEAFPLEPLGFTGKEDDLEVGLMYFGHRYLMPHLGRWASPDPLQIHAGGGGEFGNSYHYVGGNLLQARDPDGLDPDDWVEYHRENGYSALETFARTLANHGLEDTLEVYRSSNPLGIADYFDNDFGSYSAASFRAELDDGTANQMGHFLTAVGLGYGDSVAAFRRLDPTNADMRNLTIRLIVGHEGEPDPGHGGGPGPREAAFDLGWNPLNILDADDRAVGVYQSQYDSANPRAVRSFEVAIDYIKYMGNRPIDFSVLDRKLAPAIDELSIPESGPSTARGASRAGNSVEDLRNSALGFAFGEMVRDGHFANESEQYEWLQRNVAARSETE